MKNIMILNKCYKDNIVLENKKFKKMTMIIKCILFIKIGLS